MVLIEAPFSTQGAKSAKTNDNKCYFAHENPFSWVKKALYSQFHDIRPDVTKRGADCSFCIRFAQSLGYSRLIQ